jgi:DNA invertase Pin-like site-specific DNA recombinase
MSDSPSSIDYIIYCRKSSDESSDHQKQSIPDQIKACIDYAEREELTIAKKPKNFEDFQSEMELYKEENEPDIESRRIYQNTAHLFIVKEQETGKIPYKRKKWRKVMEMIEKGKIGGLLSYAPDRQARNMLEGGELINCVDE